MYEGAKGCLEFGCGCLSVRYQGVFKLSELVKVDFGIRAATLGLRYVYLQYLVHNAALTIEMLDPVQSGDDW